MTEQTENMAEAGARNELPGRRMTETIEGSLPGCPDDLRILRAAVPKLMAWYRKCGRLLPWRENPNPYRVWVSEIMLQQTRIEAAREYFRRFTEEFPDVHSLALADEERVLKLWEGLGYYSRARNLHQAAMICEKSYGGQLPDTAEELEKLPGIGPYAAGAVASIACGEAVPAVDGNVLRVMTRLLADNSDITRVPVRRKFTRMLREVIPAEAPGTFNQALMELGETICLPHGAPHCQECPVREFCRAEAAGSVQAYPVKKEKKERRTEQRTIFVICSGGKYAIRRRPETGLLADMYELPSVPGHLDREEVMRLLQDEGAQGSLTGLTPARHIFSHVEWKMCGWRIDVDGDWSGNWFYASPDEIRDKYALPSAFQAYRSLLR